MHFGEPPPEDGPLPTCPDAGSTSSETAGVKRVTWVTWVGESRAGHFGVSMGLYPKKSHLK